eukprot:1516195-Rhodomonas_salina.1
MREQVDECVLLRGWRRRAEGRSVEESDESSGVEGGNLERGGMRVGVMVRERSSVCAGTTIRYVTQETAPQRHVVSKPGIPF